MRARRIGLQLAQRLQLRVGVLARLELAAAFEHAHLPAGARQPRRCDTATITGADYDNLVVRFQFTDGT